MHKVPCDSEAMNALFELVGAMALSLAITLPAEQRQRFASNLARLAAHAQREGNAVLQTALEDIHRIVAP